MRELYASECERCPECAGYFARECPRRAYWVDQDDVRCDSPHWTGLTEEAARAKAAANPDGNTAEAVRRADAY